MPQVRSVFISDVHLGTLACRADLLIDFLREHPAEHLYLVGDIIDFWAMKRGVHWNQHQNTVVQKVLRRARNGEKVTFIPGNHDEALREHIGTDFGDIQVLRTAEHTCADGKRYLLMHGDEFDAVTKHYRWVAVLGDVAYNVLVRANLILAWFRRKLGIAGYWSLAGYAKRQVKTALSFSSSFEETVLKYAVKRGFDGVICGHIHWAKIRDIGNAKYVNCGDWVDSCTGIVEHFDGRLELIQWSRVEPQKDDAAAQ